MKPITDVLREVRRGVAVEHATRLLSEVVRAVDETGKAGSLTLVIKVKPDKGGGNGKGISVEVKAKKPEPEIPEAIFFSDEDGDLHRNDPMQAEMFAEAGERRAAVNG